jgi:hypothetical protein
VYKVSSRFFTVSERSRLWGLAFFNSPSNSSGVCRKK